MREPTIRTGSHGRHGGARPTKPSDDPESLARIAAFLQGMAELGWTHRRAAGSQNNIRAQCNQFCRWAAGDPKRYRKSAAAPLQQATRSVPIVS
jgi:hypothetical protein